MCKIIQINQTGHLAFSRYYGNEEIRAKQNWETTEPLLLVLLNQAMN
jgi:hypothetical protein